MSDWSALISAAESGDRDTAEKLLAEGADANEIDVNGATPLHWACFRNHRELCELLLAHGADVNALSEDGRTPLHLAAMGGSYELISFLLAGGAELDPRDTVEGRTPMHLAAMGGFEEVVNVLIVYGANVNEVDFGGRTALHHAVESGNEGVLHVLLALGAEIDAADREQATPLLVALQQGQTELATALLAMGASANVQESQQGTTPLHLAAALGEASLVELLLANGADPETCDLDGLRPVDVARDSGQPEIMEMLGSWSPPPGEDTGVSTVPPEEESFGQTGTAPPDREPPGAGDASPDLRDDEGREAPLAGWAPGQRDPVERAASAPEVPEHGGSGAGLAKDSEPPPPGPAETDETMARSQRFADGEGAPDSSGERTWESEEEWSDVRSLRLAPEEPPRVSYQDEGGQASGANGGVPPISRYDVGFAAEEDLDVPEPDVSGVGLTEADDFAADAGVERPADERGEGPGWPGGMAPSWSQDTVEPTPAEPAEERPARSAVTAVVVGPEARGGKRRARFVRLLAVLVAIGLGAALAAVPGVAPRVSTLIEQGTDLVDRGLSAIPLGGEGKDTLDLSPGQVPPRAGAVNDFAGALEAGTVETLQALANSLQGRGVARLTVVTVPRVGARGVADYARELAAAWDIDLGERSKEVFYLIALDEREVSIQVGGGLKDSLSEIRADYVRDVEVEPLIEGGSFDEAARTGVLAMNEFLLRAEAAAEPAVPPRAAPRKAERKRPATASTLRDARERAVRERQTREAPAPDVPAVTTVTIDSRPSGARVHVDGRSASTPCVFVLPSGPHTVSLFKRGYRPRDEKIYVDAKASRFVFDLVPVLD